MDFIPPTDAQLLLWLQTNEISEQQLQADIEAAMYLIFQLEQNEDEFIAWFGKPAYQAMLLERTRQYIYLLCALRDFRATVAAHPFSRALLAVNPSHDVAH